TVNLGYSRNFDKGICECAGDVIFISDQDDVWLPCKIECVLAEFNGDSRKFWVSINDQWITDANLKSCGETIFCNNRALRLTESNLSSGSCSAISRAFAQLCFPSPVPEIAYDSWIHRVAVMLESRSIVDRPLQYYRRHGSNAS